MNREGGEGALTSSAPPQRSQIGSKQAVIRPPTISPSSSAAQDDRAIDSDRPIFAKKSSALRNVSPPPIQPRGPIPRAKGSRQIPHSKSASSVRTSIKSVPLSSRVENDTRPSRLSDSQRGSSSNFTIARPRTSLPLPSSSSTHRLKTHGRKTATPQPGQENTRFRRWSMMTASPVPGDHATKSSSQLLPLWNIVDDASTNILSKKRPLDKDARRSVGSDFVKRIAVASRSSHRSPFSGHRSKTSSVNKSAQNLPIRYLDRRMRRLKVKKSDDESDSDSPVDEESSSDSAMQEDILPLGQRIVLDGRTGVKAARKRIWPPPEPSDEDPEEGPPTDSSDNESGADETVLPHTEGVGSNKSTSEEDEEDELLEEVFVPERSPSLPEIIFLNSPPRMIKGLPPPSPVLAELPLPPSPALDTQQPPLQAPSVPSDELVAAVEPLTLSSVRMQKLKLLPFLLRNLRKGFRHRCRVRGIPTDPRAGHVSVTVRYEHSSDSGEHMFETRMEKWLCPLCELHGAFGTRAMLASHLGWDHAEAEFHWIETQDETWLLRVVVFSQPEERPGTPMSTEDAPMQRPATPREVKGETDRSYSPFPFVTLSPQPDEAISTPAPLPLRLKFPEEPPTPRRATRLRELSRRVTPASVTRVVATPVRSSRGRSVTVTTTTNTMEEGMQRYPTPPPASNRLGPAAQPPYVPFKSEYGGPDIYYSCRPGGATVFDLLSTLPLEPFGVLAWDVLDREDEIFDSDNVQDEYKVMHALWGRWIILNRNTFVADYYKGTIAFVDTYWRMIHRAAGWDALRYWLFMLLANRFISGHEVAKILKHYEKLVGMDRWD